MLKNLSDHIIKYGKKSYSTLARQYNTSKSSICRRFKRITSRADVNGASFFETSEGKAWLKQLVVAAVFIFGIVAGIGAERIALFFSLIGITKFIGTSSGSVQRIENRIDDEIIKYQKKHDDKIKDVASDIEITPGGDETFFKDQMILVLMDLDSGFIFTEKAEEKRDHKTWEKNSLPWLSRFKLTRCFLSDKAKAILKLAKDSLFVKRIPDLFNMMSDTSSVMKFAFHRQKTSALKKIKEASKETPYEKQHIENKRIIKEQNLQIQTLSINQMSYKKNHRKLSTSLHTFKILSVKPQTTSEAEINMINSLNKIKAIKDKLNISDKGKKLARVELQIPDAASQIDMWHGWVHNSLSSAELTDEMRIWLLNYLLPLVYWQSQLKKTRSKIIKRFYKLSIKVAEKNLQSNSLTKLLLEKNKSSKWLNWARQMANIFHRTTSAIEGRNGWLSQIHFSGRGLTTKRIQSQTAIHNYYLKRKDGTTACERLSKLKPTDLFDYIIRNIGDLPEPRKRKVKRKDNPLILKAVSA